MNRVLAARSLKFSEHRNNERKRDMGKSDVVLTKKADGKGKAGKATFAASMQAHDKLKTPTIVSNIVQKEAKKKKMQAHGVWSTLGAPYLTHGVPDLDLGDDANVYEPKKQKKPRRVQRDMMPARQKLETLLDMFRTTKEELQSVNLFNRPAASGDGQQGGLLPTVAHEMQGGSRESTPRGEPDRRERRQESTMHKISMLGSEQQKERKAKVKKDQETEKFKNWRHLDESRHGHLTRWRESFEQAKDNTDRSLIQKLVLRAEDRERVYESPSLLNNAVAIIVNNSQNPNSMHMNHPSQLSVWEKARLQEFNLHKHELVTVGQGQDSPHRHNHSHHHHHQDHHQTRRSSPNHHIADHIPEEPGHGRRARRHSGNGRGWAQDSDSTNMLVTRLRKLNKTQSTRQLHGLQHKAGGGGVPGFQTGAVQPDSRRRGRTMAHSASAPGMPPRAATRAH